MTAETRTSHTTGNRRLSDAASSQIIDKTQTAWEANSSQLRGRRAAVRGMLVLALTAGVAAPLLTSCADSGGFGPQVATGHLDCRYFTDEHGKRVNVGGPRLIIYDAGQDKSRTWGSETTATMNSDQGSGAKSSPSADQSASPSVGLGTTITAWAAQKYDAQHQQGQDAADKGNLPDGWADNAPFQPVNNWQVLYSSETPPGGDVHIEVRASRFARGIFNSASMIEVGCSDSFKGPNSYNSQNISVPKQRDPLS